VKTVAVIGAGGTGRGIAYLAALHGFNTILEDVSSVRLARAMEWITQSLAQAVAERQIEGAARAAAVANFSIAGVVEDAIRAADLIIETLPEEMEMKLELFTILDKFARPGAILASAGEISITELAEITFCPDRCIGMRFGAHPVDARSVQLVTAAQTSSATLAECAKFVERLGKTVIEVPDTWTQKV
jgi:3-hydroxybutyryl-CoA dehydrogenase